MDFEAILKQLREEREQIEEAILAIERLGADQGRRRGRPPKWMQATTEAQENPKRRGRPPRKSAA